MTGLLIFVIVLAIISFTVFFRKLDEFMGLIDSIEASIEKMSENEEVMSIIYPQGEEE